MLVWGPPFNRPLEEIGWLTRRQLSKLALNYRDKNGILDLQMVRAKEESEKPKEETPDFYAQYRAIRRQQAVPEYIIDKEISFLEERHANIPK